jgi:tryptophan halogenase
VSFEQYWLKMFSQGKVPGLDAYSINHVAAAAHKFMRTATDMGNSPLRDIAYAFHFDASLFARYLRKLAEGRGVRRVEGKIVDVSLKGFTGHVDTLTLESGDKLAGDLFVDCSGFRGLLIEQVLKTGYEDWSHWLPCDRAIAVPCASSAELLPYTRSTAHTAGWQWRIPLQHRIGNGHVFSSAYMSEDEATSILLNNLDGEQLAEPRTLKFLTGMRKQAWNKNVVAIGLAGGFMEPLESTSIHLIQTAIARLVSFFPARGFSQPDIDEYNRQSRWEFEKIRDFLILHYNATQRDDSAFWNYCRTMDIPASLRERMDLFKRHGRIFRDGNELFAEVSWLQVALGQNITPQSYHPLVDLLSEQEVLDYLGNIAKVIENCAEVMPGHAEFIANTCPAPMMR